jgi:serine/threonine protein kinase
MTVAMEAGAARGAGIASGTRGPAQWLGGRFSLDERINTTGGLSQWKATDELLCRPVIIHLLPRGVPVPAYVVAAVQAAARVNDPRLATIYDTDYGLESPYIVSEWTPGTHLEDLVLSGLPSPALAAAMIADAADALAIAHQAGRPHLCLNPRSPRWDPSSGLKIAGLGIDAALSGTGAADPAAVDTMALGSMLYALLTGYWPGDGPTALPAAPRHKGRVYTPRQVRAGVPGVLDAITSRALQLQAPGAARPALTPAGLAMALRSVQRPSWTLVRPAEPLRSAPARHARTRAGVRHRTPLLRSAA